MWIRIFHLIIIIIIHPACCELELANTGGLDDSGSLVPTRSLVEPYLGLPNDLVAMQSMRRSQTSSIGLRYFSSVTRCRSISSNSSQQDEIVTQEQSATDESSSVAQLEEKATDTVMDNETAQVVMADSIDHMLSRNPRQGSPSTSSDEKEDESEQEDSLIDMVTMLSDVAKQLKVLQEHQSILIGENKLLKTKLIAAETSIGLGSPPAAKDDSSGPLTFKRSKYLGSFISAKRSPKDVSPVKATADEASDEGDSRGMLQIVKEGNPKGVPKDKAKIESVSNGTYSKHHLSHLNRNSAAQMVSVIDKPMTKRVAIAVGSMAIPLQIGKAIRKHSLRKGDVLSVARIAAIQAVKKTSDIIPLCHSGLPISGVKVYIRLIGNSEALSSAKEVDQSNDYKKYTVCFLEHKDNEISTMIKIVVQVESIGRTGVEMEALTGATAGMLTVYDMCKSMSKKLKFNVKLTYKEGGDSGTWLGSELRKYLETRSPENPI